MAALSKSRFTSLRNSRRSASLLWAERGASLLGLLLGEEDSRTLLSEQSLPQFGLGDAIGSGDQTFAGDLRGDNIGVGWGDLGQQQPNGLLSIR